MTAPLTLDDIADLRAYERTRDDFRRRVMARKRLRRIGLGPIVTAVFECAETVRFQVQEMVRVERIATDQGVQAELDVYNRLLPAEGELSATLFIELTTQEELRHWLPSLVGIERSVAFELGHPGAPPTVVWSVPEESHAESLTREAVTPAVHYLRFPFSPEARAQMAGGAPAVLAVRHRAYEATAPVPDATRRELLADLEGRTEPLPTA